MTNSSSFDENCGWPRWLLHVDSLTSYRWQPGNIYNGVIEPPYNVVSYTWGRFKLNDGEQPDIKPAPITGIPWLKELPRIRPDHYTVENLCEAIRGAACPHPDYERVEYLWLDIACIDQTPRSAEKASEIGRQIIIFRRAKDVFIWIPTHTSADITAWVEDLDELVIDAQAQPQSQAGNSTSASRERDDASRSAWLELAFRTLGLFRDDPWFSSLWTLQEAFLSPRATFIWQNSIYRRFDGESYQPFGLKDWVVYWAAVKARCDEDDMKPLRRGQILTRRIDATGLFGGVRPEILSEDIDILLEMFDTLGSPFHLLAAAGHRTTKHPEDRVYGIMQIFDLRLGTSAPNQTGNTFSLDELEIQLANALLYKYPVLSQLVTHLISRKPFPTWMVTSAISFPEEGFTAWMHDLHGGTTVQRTSFSPSASSTTAWPSFEGPVSSLSDFYQVVSSYIDQDKYIGIKLDEYWNERVGISEGDIHLYPQDHNVARILKHLSKTQILFLGRLRPPVEVSDANKEPAAELELDSDDFFVDVAVGVLVQEHQDTNGLCCYQRLGFITWDLRMIHWLADEQKQPISPEHAEYLDGNGGGWTIISGLYG